MKTQLKPKPDPVGPSLFKWQAFQYLSVHHIMYDVLTCKGMIFGCVEAFEEDGPWYGNVGYGSGIYKRTGAINSLSACRELVEMWVKIEIMELALHIGLDAKIEKCTAILPLKNSG